MEDQPMSVITEDLQIDDIERIRLTISGLERKQAQKVRLDSEILKLKKQLEELIRQYIYVTRREMFLSTHRHYQEQHPPLDVTRRHYYDFDWYKNTYGSSDAQYDKYGRETPYEGPEQEVIIVCENCDKSTRAHVKMDGEIDAQEEYNKILLDEIFSDFRKTHCKSL